MFNYILEQDDQHMVNYIMQQTGYAVASKMPFGKAVEIVRSGKPHASNKFEGYPITPDDVFYFQGEYEEDERKVVLGADGAPIPAGGVRKPKKRIKDVVCE